MRKRLLTAVALITVLCAVQLIGASHFGNSPDHETVHLKVLKVFSAKDGEGRFQAYLVRWKDQEVIVSDPLIKSNYTEGDTIPVLAMKNKYPNGKPGPDLMAFQVMPPYQK